MSKGDDHSKNFTRRDFIKTTSAMAVGLAFLGKNLTGGSKAFADGPDAKVQTVLGPISPEELGVTFMHEHCPVIDWSELYGWPSAPISSSLRNEIVNRAVGSIKDWKNLMKEWGTNSTIVECTPIRVGRYPDLIAEVAKKSGINIVAVSGFFGEELAPMHPWAVEMLMQRNGVDKVAQVYINEIKKGIEDPRGRPGVDYTSIKAGVIKTATNTYTTYLERLLATAAAQACIETGAPITTHTARGGGLELAKLLISNGVKPNKVIIGHQGYLDDRKNERATDYHKELADLGVYLQFDRLAFERQIGFYAKYPLENRAEFIKPLVTAGYEDQLLMSHDAFPYFYNSYGTEEKPESAWWYAMKRPYSPLFAVVIPKMLEAGVSENVIRKILIENPKRALAF
jgi:phosphotriesterase-related protein